MTTTQPSIKDLADEVADLMSFALQVEQMPPSDPRRHEFTYRKACLLDELRELLRHRDSGDATELSQAANLEDQEASTSTEPDCPSWCEVTYHEAERQDERTEWYTHRATILDDDEVGHVEVSACQTFPEVLRPGEVDDPPHIRVTVREDYLTPAQASTLSGAIQQAVGLLAPQGVTAPVAEAGRH